MARAGAGSGAFVTFEGADGTGKSTHIGFLAERLRERGREVLRLREPGGTAVGEALRALVLDPANAGLSDRAELLVYEAARAQLVDEVIAPALERGAVVLCDRFADSTVAYQAFGRGLPRAFVDAANGFATGQLVPDRTVLMVCGSPEAGLSRAAQAGEADRLEQAGEGFHRRVAEGFAALAASEEGRVRVVDSSGSRVATAHAVAGAVADLFPELVEAMADEAFFAPLAAADEKAAQGAPSARSEGALGGAAEGGCAHG